MDVNRHCRGGLHLYIEGRNYGRGTEVTRKCKELTSLDMIFVMSECNSIQLH